MILIDIYEFYGFVYCEFIVVGFFFVCDYFEKCCFIGVVVVDDVDYGFGRDDIV